MGATARPNASRLPAVGSAKVEEISRPQPICIEVPVTIHGVRLLTDSGKREPFSESTRTLIVFSNGAVLPLRTAVNPGQLVILTNEHTRKEIVCQVVKSTTSQNVTGYIELKFTQPSMGFWGILFPSDRSESQGPPREADVSVAPSKPQAFPAVAPQTTQPVFSSLGNAVGSHAELIQPKLASLSQSAGALEPLVFSDTREVAISAEPAAEAREDDELAVFIRRMMFEAPETESARALPHRSPIIVLIAAELLLGAFAIGGWYWWRSRAHESVAKLAPQAANAAGPVSASPTNTLTASTDSSTRAAALNIVETSSTSSPPSVKLAEDHETPNAESKTPAAISRYRLSKPHVKNSLSTASAYAEATGIDSAPEVSSRLSLEGFNTLIGEPTSPTAGRPVGGEIKAPHLISSVPPAYPSLARSQRVEGDVILDALIDQTGRVTKIRVISGPQLLQEAAAAAVRLWKYEPALLDGKAVPIHLTVTVKFQFR